MEIPKTTSFYEDLISDYLQINIPPRYEEISKINSHIAWYLADSNDYFVSAKQSKNTHIIEIDIKAAFTNICNNLFDKNSEFIQIMNTLDGKKERNIFIAKLLKGDYLKILNYICKMIIVGIVFDTDHNEDRESVTIFEIKKDGIVISCNDNTFRRLQNLNDYANTFTRQLLNFGFKFHIRSFQKYTRSNKTSIFFDNGDIRIKGHYKYIPKGVISLLHDIFTEKNIDLNHIKNIYSQERWNIIRQNVLRETLERYYICSGNGLVIDSSGKYMKFIPSTDVDPRIYLKVFIFPAILANKNN